jgi:glycosidase
VTARVPAADPGSALPPHWHRGTFLQIFVRAWRDANGDGIGDLRSIIEGLPYLQELGVSGIWLMPIHHQDGDHGYAVTDYRAIHPDYGTLAGLRRAAAPGARAGHRRDPGLRHQPQRRRAPAVRALAQRRRQPHARLVLWREPHPAGWRIHDNEPWRRDGEGSYFAAFSRHMPDFNWLNPEVAAWRHDNLRFWLNRGVDGFRFDAVGHLVENGPDDWDCQARTTRSWRCARAAGRLRARFMVCEAPAPGGLAPWPAAPSPST